MFSGNLPLLQPAVSTCSKLCPSISQSFLCNIVVVVVTFDAMLLPSQSLVCSGHQDIKHVNN